MLSFLLLPAMAIAAPVAQTAPAEPLLHDDRGRPMIRVRLNDGGPFAMVVDTAAQSSLIVPAVAAELKIVALPQTIGVEGATGATETALYPIDRFATGLFDIRDIAMPALPNIGSTDARGIVGLDAFEGRKIVFDRARSLFDVVPSSPPPPGYRAYKGRIDENGFLVIPLSLDGVPIEATVDTGAAVTIATPAVAHALGWRDDDPRWKAGGELRGATADGQRVKTATIARLKLGPATLSDVPMLFAGDLAAPPAILLGSDLLNLFDAYAVDIPRAELQIRIPAR